MEVKRDLKGWIQEGLPLHEHRQKIQGKGNRGNTEKKQGKSSFPILNFKQSDFVPGKDTEVHLFYES